MNKISNPKELTLYWHTLIAFQQAKSIANLMVSLELDEQDNRSAILFGSLCGYYARPFGGNRGIGSLSSDDIVPEPYKGRHDEMIYMRNKIFLHTDANAEMSDKTKINELKFVVAEDGKSLTVENDIVIPKKQTFGQILDLLNIVIASTNQKITNYLNEMEPGHPFEANSIYSLEICEDKISLKKDE